MASHMQSLSVNLPNACLLHACGMLCCRRQLLSLSYYTCSTTAAPQSPAAAAAAAPFVAEQHPTAATAGPAFRALLLQRHGSNLTPSHDSNVPSTNSDLRVNEATTHGVCFKRPFAALRQALAAPPPAPARPPTCCCCCCSCVWVQAPTVGFIMDTARVEAATAWAAIGFRPPLAAPPPARAGPPTCRCP